MSFFVSLCFRSTKYQSIFGSEIRQILFCLIPILTILFLLIIINLLTTTHYVMAQTLTLTLTTTNMSYDTDDIVSTRGHFNHLTTGELVSENWFLDTT
jgi:hypothetical protein